MVIGVEQEYQTTFSHTLNDAPKRIFEYSTTEIRSITPKIEVLESTTTPQSIYKVAKYRNIQQSSVIELRKFDMADSLLTSRLKPLIKIFWALVLSKIMQSDFPAQSAKVLIQKDPEENRKKVIISLKAETNASQALAFWDGLNADIDAWIVTLKDHDKRLFLRDVALQIHWSN